MLRSSASYVKDTRPILNQRYTLTLISFLVLPKYSVTTRSHPGGLNFFMGTPGDTSQGQRNNLQFLICYLNSHCPLKWES